MQRHFSGSRRPSSTHPTGRVQGLSPSRTKFHSAMPHCGASPDDGTASICSCIPITGEPASESCCLPGRQKLLSGSAREPSKREYVRTRPATWNSHSTADSAQHKKWCYELDVRNSDRSSRPISPAIPDGFSVVTLSGAQAGNTRWKEQLLSLLCAAQTDWPDPDPDPTGSSAISMSTFERLLSTISRPDAFFIAANIGRYAGFSSLYSMGTAVHPEYRGRGIATALQCQSLAKARLDGLRKITRPTANPAMQAVFRKLGFRKTLTEIRMCLRLDSTG